MERSASLFDEILAGAPSPGTLFLILARMKEEGHLKRVIQECLKALETFPHDIPLRLLLAETYFESGRIPQAESEVNRVTALIDDLAPVFRLQAEILLRQDRGNEAVAPLKRYLAHRPDDTEAHRLLEELQTPGKMITEDVGLPEIATSTLAEIYVQQGRIQEAIDTYKNVISRNPDDRTSRDRLIELKDQVEKDRISTDLSRDTEAEKKAKIISILENWRASFGDPGAEGNKQSR